MKYLVILTLAATVAFAQEKAENVAPAAPAISEKAKAVMSALQSNEAKKAVELAEASAESDADCKLMLGQLLQRGEGVAKDEKRAAKIFQELADKGVPEALVLFGACLEEGRGVPKNLDKGAFYWKQAAEGGYAKAQTALGLMAARGNGQPADLKLARGWLEKAAAQNEPQALLELSRYQLMGKAGLEKDAVKAFELAFKSANGGNLEAANQIGVLHQNGQGTRQDYAAAAGWYNFAAELGYAPAQVNLGLCYQSGRGVKASLPTALELFRRAALQSEPSGLCLLGIAYREGLGVTKDLAKAAVLLKKGAEVGSEHARTQLSSLEPSLKPDQIKEVEKLSKNPMSWLGAK
jgi:uncharacterized protein